MCTLLHYEEHQHKTAAKKQCMATEGGQLPAQCKEQPTI